MISSVAMRKVAAIVNRELANKLGSDDAYGIAQEIQGVLTDSGACAECLVEDAAHDDESSLCGSCAQAKGEYLAGAA